MERQKYKPSYLTRITCKQLESEHAFRREGEVDDANVHERAEHFAILWREIKKIRDGIRAGTLDRNREAKALKYKKKALLALSQGADSSEVARILAGDLSNFNGMKFNPTLNYMNN